MAEDNKDATGSEEEEAPKSGLLKNKFVLLGALLFLIGAGVGSYFLFFSSSGGDITSVEAELTEVDALERAKAESVVFLDIPEIMSNLSTPSDAPKYVRMKIALECPDQETLDAVLPLMPRVLDSFNVFLREIRPDDLEGSSGVFRMKEELLRRINGAIQPYAINQVLFKEFLIQ